MATKVKKKAEKKFKLGKIQKAWIKSLKANPDKQLTAKLAVGNSKEYKACCLGELLLTECRLNKKKFPFNSYGNLDDKGDTLALGTSYAKYGLKDRVGAFLQTGEYTIAGNRYKTLASANDGGATWSQIADFIEKNPEKVFTKSV